ncbi:uncharacterized protein FIBRA_05284 [Fibroporia radiculosa]|uniref:Uncharacterized protein n=1 Tax=Fibroporia radiculosa TaxID=599839 RepID=J4HX93_9APHY|nr:uncharacterized protein FIBRA_05284 [Fibroporia radiculosa]CCM03162.1 predicted protein [Fibroporia radiculosa]
MPSIRVKRGYTTLRDVSQDPDRLVRRTGTHSPTAAFTPWSLRPPSLNINQRGVAQNNTQTRTPATSVAADCETVCGRRGPPLRRPSSKISHHILNGTLTPQVGHARDLPTGFRSARPVSEDCNPFFPSIRPDEHTRRCNPTLSRHHLRGTDMISLEGPQTDVLVPAAEEEPGRIGSALSIPVSEQFKFDWGRDGDHHPDDIVEHLDVIDPQIATVATLTNAANAIVIPPLSFYSRKPVVVLPRRRRKKVLGDSVEKGEGQNQDDDEDNLDVHVEDVLRKRDRLRRVMRGVWSFVKTPLGFVTAIYGFLVVFWGTALVVFLARFIDLHNDNTQDFWIEICQQIETGLFSLPSIGLAPFRILDTYRIAKIMHYKRRTEKLRRKAGLPELYDPNDLPDPQYDANYVPVLTEEEQVDLHYQQHMFMQAQTWYRPHGTQTHRAFPIDIAIWICVMNDLNTFFQCLLSGCMWGLNRFQRPAWTTATTLPLAFVAGILAGFYIYWGSRQTKRVKEVTERLRMALAMERPNDGNGRRPAMATLRVPEAQTKGDLTQVSPEYMQTLQREDLAEEDPDADSGDTTRPTPKPPKLTPASPGIRIADEMTVPSAEVLADWAESR